MKALYFNLIWQPSKLPLGKFWGCYFSICFFKKQKSDFERGGNFTTVKGKFSSVQFSSVTQSCPTLCNPVNRSTPGLPVHHQLLSLKLMSIELVMPSSHLILCCPLLLLPPIPPSNRVLSNESTLRMRWPKYWVSALASVLPMSTQDWSPLGWTGWTSLQSKGPSRVFSNTTLQKHQFFGAQLSSQSNSHIHTWPLEKP